MESQNRSRLAPIGRAVREIVETLLWSAVLYAILSALIGRFVIQQVCMEPTFHAGQRVIVVQWEQLLSPWLTGIAHAEDGRAGMPFALQRGQVAVFYPTSAHEGTPLIKRVIGLPGDTLTIQNNQVWINGEKLSELYVHGLPTSCTNYCGPLTLGPGQYFMMGDNRTNSQDSRAFGPVAEADMVGRVVLRYWPLDALAYYP